MRLAALVLALASPAAAQTCGGPFPAFLDGLVEEATTKGHDPATARAFLATANQDPEILAADRQQGVFQRPFIDFSRRLISASRLEIGARQYQTHRATFDRIEQEYGISPGILLAFWALETDYGTFQGDFNTLDALVTLAHDCRRPELFRPQIFAALELYERGAFDPATTTGAWAGEIGMVQMLPADILENGRDGDGDGTVSLKTSPQDALLSGAAMLSSFGWRAGEPWLQEVTLPETLDWSLSGLDTRLPVTDWQGMGVTARTGTLPDGLDAALLLPQGRNGPAFLAYPNFDIFFEWNQSFVYVTTAAYMATRLMGAPVYDAGDPDQGLSPGRMEELQRRLQARGHDVGGIDGILGAKTRSAVQQVQQELGLPADAWPTPELLNRL